jgi:hypothetical protein
VSVAATFELWSVASGNVIGCFDSEAAALAAVRDALDTHGQHYVVGLALGREDSRGRSKAIARGTELLKRALTAATKGDAPSTAPDGRSSSSTTPKGWR